MTFQRAIRYLGSQNRCPAIQTLNLLTMTRNSTANRLLPAFLLSVWLCGVCFGQPSATTAKSMPYPKYSFTDTVRMENVPKEELYSRAWRWFDEQTKTDPHFLEEANMRQGRFTGTTGLPFQSKHKGGNDFVKGKIFFLVKVTVGDDYYVYEFTDFIHQGRITFNTITTAPKYPYRTASNKDWHNMVWEEIKVTIKDYTYPMVGNLRASMRKESDNFEELVAQRNAEISLEQLQNAEIGKPAGNGKAPAQKDISKTPQKTQAYKSKKTLQKKAVKSEG